MLECAHALWKEFRNVTINKGLGHEGTLSELLAVKYGKDHKNLASGTYPVYGSGGYMRSVDRPLYEGESVLIPRKGSLNNVMYVNESFWTVDTMFFTIQQTKGAAKYAYEFLRSLDLASMNAGSAVPSMTVKILDALPVFIPLESELLKFDAQVEPYLTTVRSNTNGINALNKLRDALLPKLMSGEIDVSKVELPKQSNSHLFLSHSFCRPVPMVPHRVCNPDTIQTRCPPENSEISGNQRISTKAQKLRKVKENEGNEA